MENHKRKLKSINLGINRKLIENVMVNIEYSFENVMVNMQFSTTILEIFLG